MIDLVIELILKICRRIYYRLLPETKKTRIGLFAVDYNWQ